MKKPATGHRSLRFFRVVAYASFVPKVVGAITFLGIV